MKQHDKVEAYKTLTRELYAARAERKLTDDEESNFADDLSDLWMALWPEDQEEIEAWWSIERLTLAPAAAPLEA